jgi:5,10-methylenetetrahydromethanopterin reductase
MHGKANGPVSERDREQLEMLVANYDMKQHTRADSRQAGTLADDFVDRFAIVGPPDRCIARLRELKALGLDKVAISGSTRGASAEDAAVGRDLVVRHVLPAMAA